MAGSPSAQGSRSANRGSAEGTAVADVGEFVGAEVAGGASTAAGVPGEVSVHAVAVSRTRTAGRRRRRAHRSCSAADWRLLADAGSVPGDSPSIWNFAATMLFYRLLATWSGRAAVSAVGVAIEPG